VRYSRTGPFESVHLRTDMHHTKSFSCFVGYVSVIFGAGTKEYFHIISNKEVFKGA